MILMKLKVYTSVKQIRAEVTAFITQLRTAARPLFFIAA